MSNTSSIIKKTIEKYGASREALLPVLQAVKREAGSLDAAKIREISAALDIPAADAYGVASFYSFLEPVKLGRHVIRICRTISCEMNKKQAVLNAIENKLGVKLGETTNDGMFSLLETSCLGHCHKGPVMLINDDIYTSLTPAAAVSAIEKYIGKE
ncbi:MAG TPA: NADH-quinone oxidoreductase subunit NuoE [Candidatus Wallbacteria bacterium]|nr:MAG: NADH-quinone oxidoreductase subunit E [bacterium ADurb.Bin243]HOD41480.1 NADH-quinone oxidoreductase subunit NuoE [Candidatus Wallbacteria bacterium]HPG56472.1 NADH-quinone oxidoreductase subunit NuoE [Candidatus Wallbacteria bacterium]